jgi:hypothetical protein
MAECHRPAPQNATFIQSWASKQASKGYSNNILKNTNGFLNAVIYTFLLFILSGRSKDA